MPTTCSSTLSFLHFRFMYGSHSRDRVSSDIVDAELHCNPEFADHSPLGSCREGVIGHWSFLLPVRHLIGDVACFLYGGSWRTAYPVMARSVARNDVVDVRKIRFRRDEGQ